MVFDNYTNPHLKLRGKKNSKYKHINTLLSMRWCAQFCPQDTEYMTRNGIGNTTLRQTVQWEQRSEITR